MFSNCFDPFRFFSSFTSCGSQMGRRYYTRQEQIEMLESLKKKLEKEIAGIQERIEDLRGSKV